MRYRKKTIVFLVAVALVSGGFVAVSVQSATEGPKSGADAVFANDPTGQIRNLRPELRSRDSDPQGRELFFKMMLSVLLVIALGVAAIYTCRKLLPRITNLPGKQIHILETVHLGRNCAVHLIEIEDRRQKSEDIKNSKFPATGRVRLLIGSTNENITTLADVTGALEEFSAHEVEGSHFATDCKMGTLENNVRI